jgi:prevent-host-death family protein
MIPVTDSTVSPRPRGYGLPCVKCHTYYFADLASCPVCKARDRVGRPALPQPTPSAEPLFEMVEAPAAVAISPPLAAVKDSLADCWSIILGSPKATSPTSSISTGQLRARFVHVMEEVSARRNTVLITKRGKPVARIVPAEAPDIA